MRESIPFCPACPELGREPRGSDQWHRPACRRQAFSLALTTTQLIGKTYGEGCYMVLRAAYSRTAANSRRIILREVLNHVNKPNPRPCPRLRGLCPLYPLRSLLKRLPHLPPLESRSGFPARPHPPDDSRRARQFPRHRFVCGSH